MDKPVTVEVGILRTIPEETRKQIRKEIQKCLNGEVQDILNKMF